MKFWAKSLSPLKLEKGYFETTKELMEWMEGLLDKCDYYIASINQCFVVVKIDEEKNRELLKVFNENRPKPLPAQVDEFPKLRELVGHHE